MSLKELDIKYSYISYGEENIAEAFLIPALKEAILYQRSVGYFSSSALMLIINGIVDLVRNGGKIQLVASPKISEEDVEAINLGYKKRDELVKEIFTQEFTNEIDALDDENIQLLIDLIAEDVLDIKIAVTPSFGMYHDKFGILKDIDGNIVSFHGSSNETSGGYKVNYEKIRVSKSWKTPEEVEDEVREFDSLWNNTNDKLEVYEYTQAAKKHMLQIIQGRKDGIGAHNKEPIQLYDYQKKAIKAWTDNNYRGFYVMATGTGKTWTAIYSAKKLLESQSAMIVILAPYKHLVKQWAEDVEKAMPDAKIILVSSENTHWEQQFSDVIVLQRLHPETQIIIISTISSFNLERFKKTINKSKQEKMLVVDEAHRFKNCSEEIKSQFKYLLGLSATPFSGKDAVKGQELMDFFGGRVFNLPIEEAIDKGFLVKYYYYPIFVNATNEEEEKFHIKTSQMAGCYRNGVCVEPEKFAKYYRARLRILSVAQEKMDRFENILSKVHERNHFIVYCGDGRLHDDGDEEIRHIQFVKRRLAKVGYKASQFTATENMDERMELIDAFNEGSIDVLAAIRCLDEGVNIPSIESALILSSNDDYREFVQRRGRILRKYGNKKYANIYDVIVLPSVQTPKIAEIELRRYYEYARLAINSKELLVELDNIAIEYGLRREDFITNFDDAGEAELDE